MNEKEREEIEAEYERWTNEEAQFINHPVTNLFQCVVFTSTSKGKGRKRKRPVIVALYHYRLSINRWHYMKKLPLDTLATEVYGHSEEFNEREATLTKRLENDLPIWAERKHRNDNGKY